MVLGGNWGIFVEKKSNFLSDRLKNRSIFDQFGQNLTELAALSRLKPMALKAISALTFVEVM